MKTRTPVGTKLDSSTSALDSLRSFAWDRLVRRLAHRGRRYPAGAHAGAVGAARRLHCDARPEVVPHNSLRSLRSLRSNTCGKSVHEARCARRPRSCASRRPKIAPAGYRLPRSSAQVFSTKAASGSTKARPGSLRRALRGAEKRRAGGGARSAHQELTCRILFERSERSERSELCGRHSTEHRRAVGPQGRPPRTKCRRLPGRAFVAPTCASHRPMSATGRKQASTGPVSRHAALTCNCCR